MLCLILPNCSASLAPWEHPLKQVGKLHIRRFRTLSPFFTPENNPFSQNIEQADYIGSTVADMALIICAITEIVFLM